MTAPEPDTDPNAYPDSWGYKPAVGAVAAAVDVYVSALDNAEFDAMVSRTRQGGR
jgi:hypothetical protein